MNGARTVESTLGEGTTFTVDVPYEPVVGSEAADASVVVQWGKGEWGDSPR